MLIACLIAFILIANFASAQNIDDIANCKVYCNKGGSSCNDKCSNEQLQIGVCSNNKACCSDIKNKKTLEIVGEDWSATIPDDSESIIIDFVYSKNEIPYKCLKILIEEMKKVAKNNRNIEYLLFLDHGIREGDKVFIQNTPAEKVYTELEKLRKLAGKNTEIISGNCYGIGDGKTRAICGPLVNQYKQEGRPPHVSILRGLFNTGTKNYRFIGNTFIIRNIIGDAEDIIKECENEENLDETCIKNIEDIAEIFFDKTNLEIIKNLENSNAIKEKLLRMGNLYLDKKIKSIEKDFGSFLNIVKNLRKIADESEKKMISEKVMSLLPLIDSRKKLGILNEIYQQSRSEEEKSVLLNEFEKVCDEAIAKNEPNWHWNCRDAAEIIEQFGSENFRLSSEKEKASIVKINLKIIQYSTSKEKNAGNTIQSAYKKIKEIIYDKEGNIKPGYEELEKTFKDLEPKAQELKLVAARSNSIAEKGFSGADDSMVYDNEDFVGITKPNEEGISYLIENENGITTKEILSQEKDVPCGDMCTKLGGECSTDENGEERCGGEGTIIKCVKGEKGCEPCTNKELEEGICGEEIGCANAMSNSIQASPPNQNLFEKIINKIKSLFTKKLTGFATEEKQKPGVCKRVGKVVWRVTLEGVIVSKDEQKKEIEKPKENTFYGNCKYYVKAIDSKATDYTTIPSFFSEYGLSIYGAGKKAIPGSMVMEILVVCSDQFGNKKEKVFVKNIDSKTQEEIKKELFNEDSATDETSPTTPTTQTQQQSVCARNNGICIGINELCTDYGKVFVDLNCQTGKICCIQQTNIPTPQQSQCTQNNGVCIDTNDACVTYGMVGSSLSCQAAGKNCCIEERKEETSRCDGTIRRGQIATFHGSNLVSTNQINEDCSVVLNLDCCQIEGETRSICTEQWNCNNVYNTPFVPAEPA